MTWPSFLAASIKAGVIGSGGGAAAMTRVENAAPASNAPDPLSTLRRDNPLIFIWLILPFAASTSITPEIILYSCGAKRVFRRQAFAIAARLDGQFGPTFGPKRIRENSGDGNDRAEVCACASRNSSCDAMFSAGLSDAGGQDHRSLRRGRSRGCDRAPARQRSAGEIRPSVRDRKPHRRWR